MPEQEKVQWRAKYVLRKYNFDIDKYREIFGEEAALALLETETPIEVIEREGNLLMTAGANALWTAVIGGSITAFSNANAAIGVGDSTTASAAGQTNLQAATNAFRQGQASGYPTVSTNQVQFQSVFAGASANFAWNEWGVFNAVGTGGPPSGGTMLNRAVPAGGLGTKASGSTWTLTVTLSLS